MLAIETQDRRMCTTPRLVVAKPAVQHHSALPLEDVLITTVGEDYHLSTQLSRVPRFTSSRVAAFSRDYSNSMTCACVLVESKISRLTLHCPNQQSIRPQDMQLAMLMPWFRLLARPEEFVYSVLWVCWHRRCRCLRSIILQEHRSPRGSSM